MVDYSADDIMGTSQPKKKISYSADEIYSPTPIGQSSVSEFPVDREKTRAAQELPELGQVAEAGEIKPSGLLAGEDQAKVAALVPALMTTTDPKEVAKILTTNFPNIGIQYDEGGNILAANNKTGARNILNRPGMSQRDWMEGLGITTLMLPAGRAAGALGAGAKLIPKMAAGGAAAAATQAGIEGVQELSGGTADAEEVALAGAFGAGGEALGAGISSAYKAFKETRAAKGLDVAKKQLQDTIERIKPGKEAVDALEKLTGIKVNLFQAQQTMNPTSLLKQRLLPQLDAGSRDAAKALEKQNSEVFEATAELLNKIAGPDVVETGAKRFKNAAINAIEQAKRQRSQAVKPLYDKAFTEAEKSGSAIDLSAVTKFVNEELKKLVPDDPAAKALNSFLARLKGEKVKSIHAGKIVSASGDPLIEGVAERFKPLTLEQLQSAKFTTDAAIDKSGGLVLNSAQKNAKRLLTQAEKLYVKQIGEISPKFAEANAEFARLSPAIDQMEDSLIGTAAKIKDKDLQNITSKIFGANSNPFVVKKAKEVIEAADPGAWNDLVRVELQRRIGGLDEFLKDASPEVAGDVPGALRRAIFGSAANLEKRRTLMAALTPEQRKNFTYLDEVLRRASSGRAAGSPTEPFKQITNKMRFQASRLKNVIARPINTVQTMFDETLFNKEVAALTDVMFDPNWQPKMKQIRNLTGAKADKAFYELFNVVKSSTQTAGTEKDE